MAAPQGRGERSEVHPGGSFLIQEVGSVRIPTPEGFHRRRTDYHRTAVDFSRTRSNGRRAHREEGTRPPAWTAEARPASSECSWSTFPRLKADSERQRSPSGLVAEHRAQRSWHRARRPRRHRHAAHRLLRDRGAKGEVPAQARDRRARRGLRAHRTRFRLRCARRQDPRDPPRRRQALHAQRLEAVHHQRRLRRCLHRLRQGRRREVHRLHRRARHPGLLRRGRGTQDRHPRLLHLRPRPSRTPPFPWPTSSATSARATRSRSTSSTSGGSSSGSGCSAACRGDARGDAARYARIASSSGRPIAEFGLIREKLVRMAALLHAAGAHGLPDRRPHRRAPRAAHRAGPIANRQGCRSIEEYRRGVDPEGLGLRGARAGGRRERRPSAATATSRTIPPSAPIATRASTAFFEGTERDQPDAGHRNAAQADAMKGQLPRLDFAQRVSDDLEQGIVPALKAPICSPTRPAPP